MQDDAEKNEKERKSGKREENWNKQKFFESFFILSELHIYICSAASVGQECSMIAFELKVLLYTDEN